MAKQADSNDVAAQRLSLIVAALRCSPMIAGFLDRGFWDAHYVDLVWRKDGREVVEEADWLKELWYAVRDEE